MSLWTKFLAGMTVVLAAAFLAAPADALIQESPGCVDDVSGSSNNCTANDVTFVLVGLGVQTDGCVNPADTFSIFLRAIVRNTTAQSRYDIGLYMATDGDPNGDGARTGACARQHLTPVGSSGVTTCGATALDLDGPLSGVDRNVVGVADGPYLTAETGASNSTPDLCGDLFAQGNSGCDENADGLWDDSVMDFPAAVTLPCRDLGSDGFVNIPTCATWGNQANEVAKPGVGATSQCDSEAEVIPGTPAKCRCEDTNSTVPVAQLGLTCSCTPTTVQPGQFTTCTVTYTNSSTCTPNLATPERFRCGTASFIRFKANYSAANGTISNIVPSGAGGGTASDDGAGTITWTPTSAFGTPGIIGPGLTGTLTYRYTVVANPPNPTVTIQTQTFWSNVNTFTPEVLQSSLTCASITTPVSLASASAARGDDRTVFEWTTATEAGNVGFNVYAEAADGWEKLNDAPIASKVVDGTTPQSYRYEAADVTADRFAVEEIDVFGETRLFGPFEVGEPAGIREPGETVDWAAARAAAAGAGRGPSAATAAARSGSNAVPAPSHGADVDLLVDRDGVYRVTWEQLTAAGYNFRGVATNLLAVSLRGQPVPIRVVGGPQFGPGGYLEFYGRALDTLYTTTNVYRLTVSRQLARRVAEDGRKPFGVAAGHYLHTARFARRQAYSFGSPTGDPWYDTRMLTFTGPGQWSFDFDVDGFVAGAADSTLGVDLWGSTSWPANPDHHVRVALNGVPLADETFDGRVAHPITAAIPAGLLHAGTNTLTIELPGDLGVQFDLVNLVGYSVTYPRTFAATAGGARFAAAGQRFAVTDLPTADVVAYRLDPAGPVLLSGVVVAPAGGTFTADLPGTAKADDYVVATGAARLAPELRAPRAAGYLTAGHADYLILSHAAFTGGLGPLVAMHESEGLSVRVVDVADVYARFGYGVFDPKPIRDYISYAVRYMGTRYVLLVGGDTYDYRDDLGMGSVSFIPTLYAATGSVVTFAPSDSLLADVDGDGVQDLGVGRLPVRTTAELDSVVAKTVEYAGKDYGLTGIFAADGADLANAVSFSQDSEEFITGLGEPWTIGRAYIDWLGTTDARGALLDGINRGSALTSFVGHSGPTRWTFSGLFSSADAAALTNAGRPTVVVQWGCWNTYHVEPLYNTLGHALLLSGDRGAAAVLGSATLLETASARRFSEFLAPLMAQPGTTLGDAVVTAKHRLAAEAPDLADALLGWTLLGDPALVVEP